MSRIFKFLFFIFWILACRGQAQSIQFHTLWKKDLIDLKDTSSNIKITNFKFYLTNFRWMFNDSIVDRETNSYHLLNMLDTIKTKVILRKNNSIAYNKIVFDLGVDSITNVSGAYEGDLDPTNNMYWTWQSGYINLKLEGNFENRIIREYHLGGYAYPNNCLQSITIPTSDNELQLYIHLDDFVNSIPDSFPFQVMTPMPRVKYLTHLFAKSISNEK